MGMKGGYCKSNHYPVIMKKKKAKNEFLEYYQFIKILIYRVFINIKYEKKPQRSVAHLPMARIVQWLD
ncbi:MAG: hypothetical protein BAJALOKI1v1_460016 [Promethearchaeota archaeon]|nr:MAG: hypothetical protein BAJALOKI1v1_460016 [Candidatus Lokiarchaeota archaeon]